MTPEVWRARGVLDPCDACRGLGVRMYSSGATWRGGMGVASSEYDVCDVCWGSGDAHRHGVDLRRLEGACVEWQEDQCMRYLAQRLGIGIGAMRNRVFDLANLAEKAGRRRKLPDGVDAFWWAHSWDALASILRKLAHPTPEEPSR